MYDPDRWMDFLWGAMTDIGIHEYAQLCQAAGLGHRGIINRWKKGHQPGNDTLGKLAPVLGVPVRTLLVEAGHFEAYEFIGGDHALDRIIASPILTDRQKLALIEEWRRLERERDAQFVTYVERHILDQAGKRDTGTTGQRSHD